MIFMVYSFHFEIPNEFIYFQSSFKTFEDAFLGLENMAKSHCKREGVAYGNIGWCDDGYDVMKEYMFSRTDGKLERLEKLAQFF